MDQSTQEPQTTQYWNLLVELRKETVESQKIRAQVIGFKITFVSTATALILKNDSGAREVLLVIPAFAAIFFDFLIESYSFSIKRIGRYCREHLEPVIFKHQHPDVFLTWEQYMHKPINKQWYSTIANLGITILVVIPAVIALVSPFRWTLSLPLLLALGTLLIIDLKWQLALRTFTSR